MLKRTFLFLVLTVCLIPSSFALASIQINEIMYDLKTGSDEGREWIEVYNDSDVSVDLSKFKLFEGDTNHKLVSFQGDVHIAPHGYVVIVSSAEKFKIDWPNFTGNIFDSTFSLNNSGELLAVKDEKLNILDQYAYSSTSGGSGNGKSLQKINGIWQSGVPTPGVENIIYTAPVVPKIITKNLPVQKKVTIAPAVPKEIETESLPAQVVSSEIPKVESNSLIFYLMFVIFLCAAAVTVYFVRKGGRTSEVGDDFEILEE